jgi:5-methylcytosine-specific restriction endonuclease McrA
MAGLIRTVIVNRHGQPIQASTAQRLFRGAARQVVISRGPRCAHRGCRVTAGQSQADHTTPHSHGGPTTLTNSGIACNRHNTARYQRGYTTRRDTLGWHTYRPDGTEIGFQPPDKPPD